MSLLKFANTDDPGLRRTEALCCHLSCNKLTVFVMGRWAWPPQGPFLSGLSPEESGPLLERRNNLESLEEWGHIVPTA